MNFWLKLTSVLAALLYSQIAASEVADFVVAGILILVFGIPHGASDPIIFNFVSNRDINKQPPLKFLLIYVALISGYLALWIFFPLPSLIIFLVVSAYHFGEAQFVRSGRVNLKALLAVVWGGSILLLLFLPHLDILETWLSPIIRNQTVFDFLTTHNQLINIAAIGTLLGSIAIINKKVLIKEFIELVALLILFNHVSILIAFSVFFAVWHSHDSLQLQFSGLKRLDKNLSFMKFILKLSPFSIMSILALMVFTYLAYTMDLEISWIISFFILVALITLPHSLLIHNFYKKLKLD